MGESTQQDLPDERPQTKPFAAFVQEQRGGVMHEELSQAFADLVQACTDTGKKGSLTIKVTLAPQADEITMQVFDEVKVATPKHDAKPALFFADEHGNLHRTNPRQEQIQALREVPGGKAELREAPARAAVAE